MKKLLYFISAAALMIAGASCQKEVANPAKGGLTLNASFEKIVDAKSYLDNGKVVWNEGDAIRVFSSNGGSTVMYATSEGSNVVFKEQDDQGERTLEPAFDEGQMVCAIYPSADAETVHYDSATKQVTLNISATQEYTKDSYGPAANLSTAKIEGNNAYFMNDCGILKLSLRGTYRVKAIELTSNKAEGEQLSGAFAVNVDADPFLGAVGTGIAVDADKKITLDCSSYDEVTAGTGDGGVLLDFDKATDFYIVVPAGSFGTEGFKARIISDLGEEYYDDLTATREPSKYSVINRSRVRAMEAVPTTLLPDGYTEMKWLGTNDLTEVRVTINTDISISGAKLGIFSWYVTSATFAPTTNIPIVQNWESGRNAVCVQYFETNGSKNLFSCQIASSELNAYESQNVNIAKGVPHRLVNVNDEIVTADGNPVNIFRQTKTEDYSTKAISYHVQSDHAGNYLLNGAAYIYTTDNNFVAMIPAKQGETVGLYVMPTGEFKTADSLFARNFD